MEKGTFNEIEPIQLLQNSIYGSYLVASRKIKAMELIATESPLMICPITGQIGKDLVCLTCFRLCAEKKCTKCGFPVCGPFCEKGKLHTDFECPILSSNKVQLTNPVLDITGIKVLRCLLLQDKESDKWDLLMKHDAQLQRRFQDVNTITSREHVINFILERCQLNTIYDRNTIEMIMGILDINEFCLTLNDFNRHVYLMFHKLAYLTHSCVPNMKLIWDFIPTPESTYERKNFIAKFYAWRDIEPGEILTHTYLPELWPVHQRQDFLENNFYFKCDCQLCRWELFNEISKLEEEQAEECIKDNFPFIQEIGQLFRIQG